MRIIYISLIFLLLGSTAIIAQTVSAPVTSEVTVTPEVVTTPEAKTEISGFIIDLRNTQFKPSLAPKIIRIDGLIIFDVYKVNENFASEGIVAYMESTREARAYTGKIGKNPLMITPLGINEKNKSEVVIGTAEAAELLKNKTLMGKCRVIFVI